MSRWRPLIVAMVVAVVAIGTVAEAIARQPVGSSWAFTGFLATPRNGRHPVLHIQSFESV